jgi:hypothetical protein
VVSVDVIAELVVVGDQLAVVGRERGERRDIVGVQLVESRFMRRIGAHQSLLDVGHHDFGVLRVVPDVRVAVLHHPGRPG